MSVSVSRLAMSLFEKLGASLKRRGTIYKILQKLAHLEMLRRKSTAAFEASNDRIAVWGVARQLQVRRGGVLQAALGRGRPARARGPRPGRKTAAAFERAPPGDARPPEISAAGGRDRIAAPQKIEIWRSLVIRAGRS